MAARTYTSDELIAAIAAMTPEQRRKLQRRLHTSGLFVVEELLTDQHRLAIAPAVVRSSRPAPASPRSVTTPRSASPSEPPPAAPFAPKPTAEPPPPAQHIAAPAEHIVAPAPITTRVVPSAGKVVVGAPQREPPSEDPHAMAPLPGQAPDQPIMVVFDGGSRGNPGEGYGSYQVRWPGSQPQVVRLRFGDNMTNNEAEYDTLIAALDAILKRLRDGGVDPSTARLDVRGDSMLVIKQVLGEWKCKDERMEQRRDKVRSRLRNFGEWRLTHHDRENSVRALGH